MATLVSQIVKHKGIRWIVLGWSGFIAENLILSHNREYLIDNFGDWQYHYTYTGLSVLACSSIIYAYIRYGRNCGPILDSTKYWRINSVPFKLNAFLFQTLGLIGLSQEFKNPIMFKTISDLEIEGNYHLLKENQKYYVDIICPIEHKPLKDINDIIGIKRICRYPIFWSFAFLGFGTALKTVYCSSIIVYIFPGIFALIGSLHQDYRFKRNGSLTKEIKDHSCLFPFISLIKRKQSWEALFSEMKYTHLCFGLTTSLYMNWMTL